MSAIEILFVDDDPFLLQSLRLRLWEESLEWELGYAPNPAVALERLAERPAGILVSRSISLGGRDTLVGDVARKWPQTIRLLVTSSPQERTGSAIGPANRALAEPCDSATLLDVLQRTLALECYLANDAWPTVHRELPPGFLQLSPDTARELEWLQAPEHDVRELSRDVCAREPELARCVVELYLATVDFLPATGGATPASLAGTLRVSSAQRRDAAPPQAHAPANLQGGLEGVFGSLEANELRGLMIAATLWAHALTTSELDDREPVGGWLRYLMNQAGMRGRLAARMMAGQRQTGSQGNECLLGGLLSTIGQVAMLKYHPQDWLQTRELAMRLHRPMAATEREVFGIHHGQMGALLGRCWGVNDSILEALAFAADPTAVVADQLTPAVALAAAAAIVDRVQRQASAEPDGHPALQDEMLAMLERAGLIAQLPEWLTLAGLPYPS